MKVKIGAKLKRDIKKYLDISTKRLSAEDLATIICEYYCSIHKIKITAAQSIVLIRITTRLIKNENDLFIISDEKKSIISRLGDNFIRKIESWLNEDPDVNRDKRWEWPVYRYR